MMMVVVVVVMGDSSSGDWLLIASIIVPYVCSILSQSSAKCLILLKHTKCLCELPGELRFSLNCSHNDSYFSIAVVVLALFPVVSFFIE